MTTAETVALDDGTRILRTETRALTLDARKLGNGSFGEVFRGTDQEGSNFAVKMIPRVPGGDSQNQFDKFVREAQLQHSCGAHPNVVKVFEMPMTSTHLCIVMELAPGGDLFDLVVQLGGLNEEAARGFAVQLFGCLAWMHGNGLYHRDIKPENLLLDHDRQRLLITDFGYAKMLTPDSLLQTPCGTHKFMAPEILQIIEHQQARAYDGGAVDVWAAGVVVFVMCAASFPWTLAHSSMCLHRDQCPSAEYARHERGEWEMPEGFSPQLGDFLRQCCVIDPTNRATAADLVNHPWLATQLPEPELVYRSSSDFSNEVSAEFLSTGFDVARHNSCGQRTLQLAHGLDRVHELLLQQFQVETRGSDELLVSAKAAGGTQVVLFAEQKQSGTEISFSREKGDCALGYHLMVNSILQAIEDP